MNGDDIKCKLLNECEKCIAIICMVAEKIYKNI